MEAYEFQTEVSDGIIHIPNEYKNRVADNVRVILLIDKPSAQSSHLIDTKKPTFSAMKLDTRGFIFDREEANER
jgi:hypothetical protein